MLDGAHVLILEDEPIIALDLALTIEAADGHVVGPAETVAAALALLNRQQVSGAILDANLPHGELAPVAILLIERGIPVIIYSSVGAPDELRKLHPNVPVCLKPTGCGRVVEALSKSWWDGTRLPKVISELTPPSSVLASPCALRMSDSQGPGRHQVPD